MKVFLGGEGQKELGDWIKHPSYRGEHPRHGVVGVLLKKTAPDGWDVGGAIKWSQLRKLRVGKHGNAESRNVRGLVLQAVEAGCDAVAFVRDRDGDVARQTCFEEGIEQAMGDHLDCPELIGAMVIEKLECWIVALAGHRGSESMREGRIRTIFDKLDIEWKNTGDYADFSEDVDLNSVPKDAVSLLSWLERSGEVLGEADR